MTTYKNTRKHAKSILTEYPKICLEAFIFWHIIGGVVIRDRILTAILKNCVFFDHFRDRFGGAGIQVRVGFEGCLYIFMP